MVQLVIPTRLLQVLTIVLSHLVDFFQLNGLLVMYFLYCGCGLFWQTNLFHERALYGTKLHWFTGPVD